MTDTGLFERIDESRRLRGLLVPYGEESRHSVTTEPVLFERGSVRLPRDPAVVTLNRSHDRFDPIGRAVSLEDTDAGIVAEFEVANTDEGDEYLAEYAAGKRRRLSAEVRDLVRLAAKKATAKLTGAAAVPEGAFASAALFEIAEVPAEAAAEPNPQHLAVAADVLPDDITVTTPAGDTATYTPEDAPSEDNQEGEFAAMTTSIVPDGVVTPEADTIDTSASALFAALARNANTGDRAPLAPFADVDSANTGLFALSDITATGTAATVQAQFVGEIWKRKLYAQRVLPLFGHENLTALKVSGWRWTTPPVVGPWAGDKAEVPSNAVAFGTVDVTAERLAGAHDVDRALRDFGNETFWSGYFRAMTESYAKQADDKVLAKIIAAPNQAQGVGATVVAPGAVPANVDAGVAALVDGALAVITAGYTPTFSLVSTAIYRTLLLTKKDQVLEFLTSALGLEEGSLAGFRVIPHATLAAKRVIVGAREAATVYELPGSPIRVEGLDIAKGGIDPAVYGYIATVVNDVTALASVTTL